MKTINFSIPAMLSDVSMYTGMLTPAGVPTNHEHPGRDLQLYNNVDDRLTPVLHAIDCDDPTMLLVRSKF
jgi:hypothetical protein